MSNLQQRQLSHILEYGDKDEIEQSIELLTNRLYKLGEEEGHSKGFDKGYSVGKEEGYEEGKGGY